MLLREIWKLNKVATSNKISIEKHNTWCSVSLRASSCRFGASCARYVKAGLPLLDSTSSANVLVVLATGIALAVLGALFLVIAVFVIIRQRRQLMSLRRSRYRRPVVYFNYIEMASPNVSEIFTLHGAHGIAFISPSPCLLDTIHNQKQDQTVLSRRIT